MFEVLPKGRETTVPTFLAFSLFPSFFNDFTWVSEGICRCGSSLMDRGERCPLSMLPSVLLVILVLLPLFSAYMPIILSVFISFLEGFFLKLSSPSSRRSVRGGERFPLAISLS